jgi:hypothetical protein
MPTAYHLYTVKALPRGPRYGTEDQLYLTINQRENQENVHTTVELTDATFREGVARYNCNHDFLTKLRYPGRALGMHFERFVTPYEFPIYVFAASAQATGPTFVVRTKSKVSEDCVKRLNTNLDDFVVVEKHLDFQRLRALMNSIRGAWFQKMDVMNLATAGLFGPHVDRTEEFAHAERHGRLHSLTAPYVFNGAEYLVTITEGGSVIVFDALTGEEEGVDLVWDVKRSLLDKCWDMG